MKIRLITRPINKIKQVILDFIHHNHIIRPLAKVVIASSSDLPVQRLS